MAFPRQDLATDFGTANTVIFKDDQVVLEEATITALESKTGALNAIGKEAQQKEEHAPPRLYTIWPLMNGVSADYDSAKISSQYSSKKRPKTKGGLHKIFKKGLSRSRIKISRFWYNFAPRFE